jgi:site-specific DNA recombinase
MKAALYLRVSTDAQADKDLSLPAQEAQLKALAAEKGWDVVRVFTEAGRSGTNDQRPQLQAMLAEALSKRPPFEVVLVYAVDRFGRGPADPLNAQRMLDHRVRLFSKYENCFADENWLLFSIQNVMAQEYSRKLREVVPRGQRQSVSQGRGNGAGRRDAFGYAEQIELDGTKVRKRLVIDKKWAPYVKQLFERYADGDSTKSLARWLTEKKVPTAAQRRGFKARGATHGIWLESTVLKLLRNPIFTGYMVYGRVSVRKMQTGHTRTTRNAQEKWTWSPEPTHPAIISKELFERVQRKMAGNKQFRAREGRPENFLREIGFCKCGSSLSFEDNGPKNGSKMFWFCRRHRRHKGLRQPSCSGAYPQDVVEDALTATLLMICLPEVLEAGVKEYNRNRQETPEQEMLKSLEATVAEWERKESNLLDLIADRGKSASLTKKLDDAEAALKKARTDLADQKAKISTPISLDGKRMLKDGMALWEAIVGADRGSIARLIPHLISRVVLDFDATKRKAAIEYWRRDLSKELRAELEREGKATQQLIDRLIERHPAPKGAIDIYVKWSKSALLLSAAQLSQVGKFATISRQGRV